VALDDRYVVKEDAVEAEGSEDSESSCLDSDCAELYFRVCKDTGTEISQQLKVGHLYSSDVAHWRSCSFR
jgi:hypothetical protein